MSAGFGRLGEPVERTRARVRMAARALGRNGLGHAFGHVSARLDDASFLVCAPRPLALVAPGDEGVVAPVEGPLPDGVLGEVVCHQSIYRRRADVNGIARTFLRDVMTLSTFRRTPRARIGFGSYFAPCPPLWDDPQLVRSGEAAAALAEALGGARALVMRGNGCILVGATVEEAVVMAFFLEQAAAAELAVMATGREADSAVLSEREAEARAVSTGRIYERVWEHLTAGDPEAGG